MLEIGDAYRKLWLRCSCQFLWCALALRGGDSELRRYLRGEGARDGKSGAESATVRTDYRDSVEKHSQRSYQRPISRPCLYTVLMMLCIYVLCHVMQAQL
jgi:hypothetical protein